MSDTDFSVNANQANSPVYKKPKLVTFLDQLKKSDRFADSTALVCSLLMLAAVTIVLLPLNLTSLLFNEDHVVKAKDLLIAGFAVPIISLYAYLAVFILELFVLGYDKSSLKSVLKPDGSTKTDLFIFFLNIVGLDKFFKIFSFFFIAYIVEHLAYDHLSMNLVTALPSPLLQALVVLTIIDFVDYWRHRFGHRISWWWATHLHHHSASKFNIITVGRSHPLDLALTDVFLVIPAVLIGTPLYTFILVQFLSSIIGKLQHSMLPWDWGFIGKYIFISPIGHRIHHSPNPEHWDKNFGHIFVFWDRMFGTWYTGTRVNQRVGLWHNPENKTNMLSDWIRAELEFLKCIFSKWRFKEGVIKKDKLEKLTQQYLDDCEAKGIVP